MLIIVMIAQLNLIFTGDSVYYQGYVAGCKEASKIMPFSAFKDGFLGGLVLNIAGGCCAVGSKIFPEEPKFTYFNDYFNEMNFSDIRYKTGYKDGYKMTSIKRKVTWATAGSIIGIACNIASVVIVFGKFIK